MKTTTFVQDINGTKYKVTIPENRVDSVISRVDKWNERGKFEKSLELIQPFLGENVAVATPVSPAKTKKNEIQTFIEQHRAKGQHVVMQLLRDELGLNKAQAYYQTRKAGLR